MNFDQAFARVVGIEKGYVNDAQDPGGETNFGISKRSYPGEDIKNMTLERAKQIYLKDFWGAAGCDALPDEIKDDVFDTAVNSGVERSIRLLQQACGEDVDGKLGPRTLQACNSMPAGRLVARFQGHRLAFMADLPAWTRFGRGWARRAALYLIEA